MSESTRDQFENRVEVAISKYARLLREKIAQLSFSQESMHDAIEHLLNTRRNPEEYSEYDEAVQEAIVLLKGIPANPSKSGQSALIRDAYVFAGRGGDYVNSSEQAAAAFLARVVSRAKLLANRRARPAEQLSMGNRQFFILKGSRGCGKTFFQNYLFSRFTTTLSGARCIAIRITLTRDRGLDSDIEGWFYLQAAKIVLRYYDPQSARFNTSNFEIPAYSWLESECDESQAQELQAMKEAFMGHAGARNLSALNRTLADKIYRYCESTLGVSFICLIDGFDRLGRDGDASRRFERLKSSVRQLLQPDVSVGAAFVIAMRNSTFSTFYQRNQAFGPDRLIEVVEVGVPSVQSVLERRLRSLEQHLSHGYSTGLSKEVTDRMRHLFSEFRKRLARRETFDQVTQVLQAAAPNLRAAMQALATIFFHFATQRLPDAYKVIEQLLRARRTFPPIGFEFARHSDGFSFEVAEDLADTPYDSVLAPLIYKNAPIDGSSVGERYSSKKAMVHVLRVIMYLLTKNSEVFADDVANIFEENYDYPKSITIAVLDVLENFDCVFSTATLDDQDREDASLRRVEITPHGHALIKDYCMDPAYLNLSAWRIKIPRRVVDKRFVRLAFLSGNQKFPTVPSGLRAWIEAKILNSAYVVCAVIDALCSTRPSVFSDPVIGAVEAELEIQYERIFLEFFERTRNILFSQGITKTDIENFTEELEVQIRYLERM